MHRNTVLFTNTFLMSTAVNMLIFSQVFLLADRFGMEGGAIGLFLALGYGAYMAGCSLYHRLETRLFPGFSLPLAALVMGAACLLLWLTPLPAVAALSYGIIHGSIGFFWPPLMGWFTRGLAKHELNRDMGWFNQSWTMGGLLAPFAAGALYFRSPRADFTVIIGSLFLIALLQAAGLFLAGGMSHREYRSGAPLNPENGRDPVQAEPADRSGEQPGAEEEIRPAEPRLRFPSWVGNFCAYAFLGVMVNILPLEIRDGLGFSEQTAGTLLLFRGLASLAGFTLLSRLVFWHFNPRWIMTTQLALITLPLLFLASSGSLPLYGLLLCLFGLVFSGSYNNSLFHSSAGAANTGRRMAVHEGVLTAGVAFGSFGGGLVHQHFGFAGALIFLTLLQTAGFLIVLVILRKIGYHGKKKKAVAR